MAVTWFVTPFVIRLARMLGAIDEPAARKAHATPMPRIGGIAVFAGFVGGLTVSAFAVGKLFSFEQSTIDWRGLVIATTGILLVGLIDDLRGLSFYWKFGAQFIAAGFVWTSGFRIDTVSNPFGDPFELGILSLPLTLVWIVGITNAVNLIDGLDGLASGIALITCLTVAGIGMVSGALGVTAASVALAGALIGFLRWNFNPAQIFLGDCGSLFLGFVLAVTSVRGSQKTPTAVAVLVPLLVLGLPLMDTSLAIVRRLWRIAASDGAASNRARYLLSNIHQVFLPDKDHMHHRLMAVGLSHRNAVLTLYVVGTVFAAAAFGMVLIKSAWIAFLLLGGLGLAMATFVIVLYFRWGPPPRQGTPGRRIVDSSANAPLPASSAASSGASSAVSAGGGGHR